MRPINESLATCNVWSTESRLLPAVLLLMLLALTWWLQRKPSGTHAHPIGQAQRFFGWAVVLLAMVGGGIEVYVNAHDQEATRLFRPQVAISLLLVLAVPWCARAIKAYPPETRRLLFTYRHFIPALCALCTTAVIVGCIFASHFLEFVENDRLRALYKLVAQAPEGVDGHDFGARAMHAVTMGLTLLASVVAAWAAAAVWWRCRSRAFAWQGAGWIALVASTVALGLNELGLRHLTQGLDSAYGNVLLCANWERTGAPWMAMFADANNVLGIFIPVVLALGMCLLMEPLITEKDEDTLAAIASNSRFLDVLLYVGAACLAFGILHLSSAYGSALATLPSAATVKIRADSCKSLSLPPGVIDANAQKRLLAQWVSLKCDKLAEDARDAEVADSAREFAKTTTLVFGISFSALLAAMYLPSMLLLKRAADESPLPYKRGHVDSRARRSEQYLKLGIESDMLGKVGKVITALSPIFASVLANALSSIG